MPTVNEYAKQILDHLLVLHAGLEAHADEIIAGKVQQYIAEHGQEPGREERLQIEVGASPQVWDQFYHKVGAFVIDNIVEEMYPDELKQLPRAVFYMFGQYEEELTVPSEQLQLYLQGLVDYYSTFPGLLNASVYKLPPGVRVTDLWQLLIDGKRQGSGRFFEFDAREPGYIQGTMTALTVALHQIGSPVTVASVAAIQQAATTKVFNNEGHGLFSGFRDNYTMDFTVTMGETATQAGIEELRQRVSTPGDLMYDWMELLEVGSGKIHYKYPKATPEELRSRLDKVVMDYNSAIASALNDHEKMVAIATLARGVDQLHVFGDANIRTSYILANRLLAEQGLMLMILDNPNVFDGYSIPELIEEMKKGQQTFKDKCVPELEPYRPRSGGFTEPPIRQRANAMPSSAHKTRVGDTMHYQLDKA